ncbi:MAG: hypothetical protein IJA61_01650 [Clostridia bacterium]|nr:hypothetical protein [Clostridia bacterium]
MDDNFLVKIRRLGILKDFLNKSDGQFMIHSDKYAQSLILSEEKNFVAAMHQYDAKGEGETATIVSSPEIADYIDVKELDENYKYMFAVSTRQYPTRNTTILLANDFDDLYYNVQILAKGYMNGAKDGSLPEDSGLDVHFCGSQDKAFLHLTMLYNYYGEYGYRGDAVADLPNVMRDIYQQYIEEEQDLAQ